MFSALELHPKLLELELVGCGITDELLLELKRAMEKGNTMTKINLASNKITSKSAKTIMEIVKGETNQKLMSLTLDNNQIQDISVRLMAQGLGEKYKALSEAKSDTYICPMEVLSLKQTGVGDQGILDLMHMFEDIVARNHQNSDDYKNMLALHLGENDISDSGVKLIAELLSKFNAISFLGLTNIP